MEYAYYIALDTAHPVWCPVTKEEFVRKERQAGFHNTMGQPDEPATGGFSGGGVVGTIRNEYNRLRTGSVNVPREGEYLVRNGVIYNVYETDLMDTDDTGATWHVYTMPL